MEIFWGNFSPTNHQLSVLYNDKEERLLVLTTLLNMIHLLISKSAHLFLLPMSSAVPFSRTGRHFISTITPHGDHASSALILRSSSSSSPSAVLASPSTSHASFQLACVRGYASGGFRRSFSLHTHTYSDQEGRPQPDYPKPKDIHIPLDKVQFAFARSSGPGGQNVNKLNTKAELRFVGK